MKNLLNKFNLNALEALDLTPEQVEAFITSRVKFWDEHNVHFVSNEDWPAIEPVADYEATELAGCLEDLLLDASEDDLATELSDFIEDSIRKELEDERLVGEELLNDLSGRCDSVYVYVDEFYDANRTQIFPFSE